MLHTHILFCADTKRVFLIFFNFFYQRRWGEKRALDSHRREPLVFEVQVVKVKNRDESSE